MNQAEVARAFKLHGPASVSVYLLYRYKAQPSIFKNTLWARHFMKKEEESDTYEVTGVHGSPDVREEFDTGCAASHDC